MRRLWRKIKLAWALVRLERQVDNTTLKGAVRSGTSVSGAVAATLALIPLWLPVISGAQPVTEMVIAETMGVVSLWVVLVFARRAIAKSGVPNGN